MDVVAGIFSLMIILSILVIVHEWGHFIAAKSFGMRVEDFSVFFGKVIWRIGERGGTVYNIRSIPLGGYVRIAGMEADDISGGKPILHAIRNPEHGGAQDIEAVLRELNTDTMAGIELDKVSSETRELIVRSITPYGKLTDEGRAEIKVLTTSPQITADEHKLLDMMLQADSRSEDKGLYNNKPLYQRAITIFAGPFMSLFFAYIVFCSMGMTVGLPSNKLTTQVQVLPDGSARKAGIMTGDRIVGINGDPINTGRQLTERIHASANIPLNLKILRGGQTLLINVTPQPKQVEKYVDDKQVFENGKPVMQTIGLIGVLPNAVFERLGLVKSVEAGTDITKSYVVGLLSTVFSKHVKDAVGGPIAMGQMATAAQKMGIPHLVMFGAMISLSLGIMNLLPIPILDGGHLLLLAIEKIRKRKLSPREVWKAQMVGLSLLGLLVVMVMYNDIARIIMGKSFQ